MKTLIKNEDRAAVADTMTLIVSGEAAVDSGYATAYALGVRSSDWKCPTIKPHKSDVGVTVANPESSCTAAQWKENKVFVLTLMPEAHQQLAAMDIKDDPKEAMRLALVVSKQDKLTEKEVATVKRTVSMSVSSRMHKFVLGLDRAAVAIGDQKYIDKTAKAIDKATAIKKGPDAGKSGVKGADLDRCDKASQELVKVAKQMKDAESPIHDLEDVKELLECMDAVNVVLAKLRAAEKAAA